MLDNSFTSNSSPSGGKNSGSSLKSSQIIIIHLSSSTYLHICRKLWCGRAMLAQAPCPPCRHGGPAWPNHSGSSTCSAHWQWTGHTEVKNVLKEIEWFKNQWYRKLHYSFYVLSTNWYYQIKSRTVELFHSSPLVQGRKLQKTWLHNHLGTLHEHF